MGGDLTQQYLADNGVRVLRDRYDFATFHQEELKASKYTGPDKRMKRISDDTGRPFGTKTILPSTITGTPRWQAEQYRDVLSLVMHMGRPDLFITMTCNPNWREIKGNLLPHQTTADRPDLMARVFALKLKVFMDYLTKGIFMLILFYLK